MTEEELVRRCIANERQYQEMLYRKYADTMYTVCLSYTDNEDEACDILQEQQRDSALVAQFDEVGPFQGRFTEQHAVIGNDANGISVNPSEARY